MSETKRENPFPFSETNQRYHTLSHEYKRVFGGRCVKLAVDGSFSCPNRDGTVGKGGCSFCSEKGSGEFTPGREMTITDQLAAAAKRMEGKWKEKRYIAFFQSFSGTYAPVGVLRERYEEALAFPGVVGLSVSTRPDCLPGDVVDYLAELNERTFLTVELGLQSAKDETLRRIGRGHDFASFLEGYRRLSARGIRVCVHLIDGLPGENREDMLLTAEKVALLRPYAVKIHLLHVLRHTRLAAEYENKEFSCLSREEYVETVIGQLERLPPETVICRLSGDGKKEDLIAPLWSLRKRELLNEIDKRMQERQTYQGILWQNAQ